MTLSQVQSGHAFEYGIAIAFLLAGSAGLLSGWRAMRVAHADVTPATLLTTVTVVTPGAYQCRAVPSGLPDWTQWEALNPNNVVVARIAMPSTCVHVSSCVWQCS